MPFYKKVLNKKNKLILLGGLLIPLIIFLNRFLLPDLSFDSVNYHVLSGSRFYDFWKYFNIEFFPAGLHSFPPIFDYFGGILRSILGYRMGTITSLIFLYAIILLLFRLSQVFINKKISSSFVLTLFFINIFVSLEIFFQLGTYFVDIIGAFFVLWSVYLYFLYLKKKKNIFLYLSALLIGFSVAGKLTNLIYLIPLVIIAIYNEFRSSITFKQKIKFLLVFGLLIMLPIGTSFIRNTIQTGNPVFPFYNSIFKSKYYPEISFENNAFGGNTFVEKLFWPIVSISKHERLSEAHDLFNDFKLNLYFILLLPSLYFSFKIRRKDDLFYYLNLYLFGSFMVWNFSFGYLRYAFVLEILSGFIVLIWVAKLLKRKSSVNKDRLLLLLIPLLFLLGYLDKRAINVNLAYDLSWRKTLFYNRSEYVSEWKNLFVNKLDIVDMTGNNYPDVFLNCSAPGLAFYPLSQFNGIPIVNIDNRASRDMTQNIFYNQELNSRILLKYNGRKQINFVTIVGNQGLTNQYQDCKSTLKLRNFIVKKEINSDNFLGYKGQKLVYIFGEYSL